MTRDLTAGDQRLVRATAHRIAMQSAALVGIVVVALAALAALVGLHQQHRDADTLLRQAADSADDVGDPPAGVWLTVRSAAHSATTADAPAPLPDVAALDQVSRTGRSLVVDVHGAGREFRVRTQVRGSDTVQAALDLGPQHAEQRRLVEALLVGGGLGLVAAGGIGLVLGRRAVQPLAQALALQRDFVADASHELRTPLTLLSTRAQLLARTLHSSGADTGTVADGDGVVRDTARLVEVVDDLLLAAESTRRDSREPVDLRLLCAELADSARPFADGRGIEIVVASLAGHETLVQGSAVALRRALMALVDNAITHTPSGGRIVLTARRSGSHCTVDVADTGAGLDPSEARQVFARFHSGGHRAGGRSYGLGLSLASAVAAQHSGSLSVIDSSPSGTTFQLRIPVAP